MSKMVGKSLSASLLALAMGSGPVAAQDRPQVVATIGMIADVAAEIAGDCADVSALMGPGTDPHLYRPTAADVRSLRGADAILYAGYGLEGQLASILDQLGGALPTLAVGPSSVPVDELITAQDLYGIDPHLWMDVRLWSMTVPVLSDFLAGLAPDCDGIGDRAAAYGARLDALHDWVTDTIVSIPDQTRALVTAHDAFAYYARAYGIEEISIQGISTESEASIADIRETAALVATREIPAVFVETTINPRTIEAMIAAARDLGHDVEIGGSLYADAMDHEGTLAGTYIGMIMVNTTTIAEALGGTPAELPVALQDWLRDSGLARD